jgi:hypothetical protein
MKKIYIITEGSYSDYHIVGVAEDRESAELLMEKWCADDIEEFNINTVDDAKSIQNKSVFEVTMWKNGKSSVRIPKYNHQIDVHTSPDFYFFGGMLSGGIDVIMSLYCWADNEEHAVKIANEYRTMMIASGEWDSNVIEKKREQEEEYALQRKRNFKSEADVENCDHVNYWNERPALYVVESYRGDGKYIVSTCKKCLKVLKEELVS